MNTAKELTPGRAAIDALERRDLFVSRAMWLCLTLALVALLVPATPEWVATVLTAATWFFIGQTVALAFAARNTLVILEDLEKKLGRKP